jgi:acyl-CoA thioester hydrolase
VAGKTYHHEHRVTYAECTLGNHIYYARYLDVLESARGEFFRVLGFPLSKLQNQDTAFPVTECQLKYRSAARYDDVLGIDVWLEELGRIRLRFGYRISNQAGHLILEGSTLHVCTTTSEKPKRVPFELTAALESYLPVKH